MPKFFNPQAELHIQKSGMLGVWEQIEKAGRCCYKSEGKTQYNEEGRSTTAEAFANKLIKTFKHLSVAEHGTIYLTIKLIGDRWTNGQEAKIDFYEKNPYSKVNIQSDSVSCYAYITTNYRVIVENELYEDLEKYMVDPTPYHIPRYTVRVFTDRGVSAEANRHRVDSPSERSTRYVNYGHEGEVSISIPADFTEKQIDDRLYKYWDTPDGTPGKTHKVMCEEIVNGNHHEGTEFDWEHIDYWLYAILAAEFSYMNLLRLGCKPQQARRVLPFSTQTELYITAFEDDWVKFIGQRYFGTTGTPHPDMKLLTSHIIEEFQKVDSMREKIEKLKD